MKLFFIVLFTAFFLAGHTQRKADILQYKYSIELNDNNDTIYGLAEIIPSWKKQARSKALVTIRQMLDTLINVTEDEPLPLRVLEIKDIRSRRSGTFEKLVKLKTTRQKASYL